MGCKLNGTTLSTGTTDGRMMYIFQQCMTQKQNWVTMTPTLACAIVGNAYGESGCNASSYNPKDCDKNGNCAPAGGLFGFRGAKGEKFDEMVAFCRNRGKDWKQDYEGQMEYLFSDAWKWNWGEFTKWYANNKNAGLETLVRGFQTEWERGSWNSGRLQGAKKMVSLLDKYGEGCTVNVEGGGDPSDPCDTYQMSAGEIEAMMNGDDLPYEGQGVGHWIALIADSWGVGLVKCGAMTKERFNVSHVKGSMPVSWFAEQIETYAKAEGIRIIILTSGLNSVAHGIKSITQEYKDCLTNAYEAGVMIVYVVCIPYTRHSNKQVFNDEHIDQINDALQTLCGNITKQHLEKGEHFYAIFLRMPSTMEEVRKPMKEGEFHATPSGYRLWFSSIVNSMEKQTPEYYRKKYNYRPKPQPTPQSQPEKKTTQNRRTYQYNYVPDSTGIM